MQTKIIESKKPAADVEAAAPVEMTCSVCSVPRSYPAGAVPTDGVCPRCKRKMQSGAPLPAVVVPPAGGEQAILKFPGGDAAVVGEPIPAKPKRTKAATPAAEAPTPTAAAPIAPTAAEPKPVASPKRRKGDKPAGGDVADRPSVIENPALDVYVPDDVANLETLFRDNPYLAYLAKPAADGTEFIVVRCRHSIVGRAPLMPSPTGMFVGELVDVDVNGLSDAMKNKLRAKLEKMILEHCKLAKNYAPSSTVGVDTVAIFSADSNDEGTDDMKKTAKKSGGKAPKGAKPAKAVKAKAVADADESTGRKGSKYTLFGQPATAIIRWCGKNGFTFESCRKALNAHKLSAVSDATIRIQIKAMEKRGPIPELTKEQAADLKKHK